MLNPQKQFYKSSSYSSSKNQHQHRTNLIDLTESNSRDCLHLYDKLSALLCESINSEILDSDALP